MRSSLKTTLAAAAVAASVALFGAGPAQASFTFVGGVGTGSFTIGDKLFNNFTCTGVSDCTKVAYDPLTNQFGVQFNPGAALNLAGPGSEDILLTFEVSTTDGKSLIKDFFLNSNAAFTGTGSVSDTLEICADQACQTVIFAPHLVTTNGANPGAFNFSDFDLAGGPYQHIWIFDDVSTIVPVGTVGAAQISQLTKVVTQSTPEPASLLLVGAALLGMGVVRRRRSK